MTDIEEYKMKPMESYSTFSLAPMSDQRTIYHIFNLRNFRNGFNTRLLEKNYIRLLNLLGHDHKACSIIGTLYVILRNPEWEANLRIFGNSELDSLNLDWKEIERIYRMKVLTWNEYEDVEVMDIKHQPKLT